MPEVASLSVLIDADTKGLEDGVARANQQFSGLQTMMGAAALAGGAAIAAGLAVGVKAAGDLQQSVANISSINPTIDTSGVFRALNEMSTRIPATASELGDSLYNVFSSMEVGQEQALELVETFAKGAVGAGTSAEKFGTAAMGVMNAYKLEASDAAAVSDMFFDIVNKGVVTGDELAASLGPVTQSAKAMGVSWQDLGPMIAAVTKEGGPAAQNINNLNNLFMKFSTTAAQKALTDMGIRTTELDGSFRKMPDVLNELKAHLATLTEAEAAAAMQTIFPDAQARQGAQTLMSQIDFVNEALKTNQEASGSTAAAYLKMSETFNSQSKLLVNAMMAIGTAIGAEVLPHLTPLITALSKTLPAAFQDVKDAAGTVKQVLTGEWAPDSSIRPFTLAVGNAAVVLRDTFGPAVTAVGGFLQQLSTWFQANVAPIAAFTTGFLGAIAAAGVLSAAVAAVAAVLALLLSPLGLVAIAVGLLAAAWTTNFLGIQEHTAAFWAYIQPILSELVAWLGERIPPVLEWISNTGWPALVTAGQAVAAFVTGTLVPALTEAVEWLGPKISAVVTWIYQTGWPALVTAGTAVGTMVVSVTGFFTALFAELEKRGVFTQLQEMWNTLASIGGQLASIITSVTAAFQPLFDIIARILSAQAALLIQFFGDLTAKAGTGATAVETIAGALNSFFAIIQSQLSVFQTFLGYLDRLANFKMPSFSLPSFGGGGTPGATPLSYTGGSSDPAAYLASAALARGIDPQQVLAVMGSEGPGGWGAVGSFPTGTSYGPLQLHYAGGPNPQAGMGDAFTRATGIDLRTDKSLEAQQRAIDYALDQLSRTGDYREWYGADPALGSRFTPVRRVTPQASSGEMQRIPLSSSPGANPAEWPGFMHQTFEQLPTYLQSLETIQSAGAETFVSVLDAGVAAGGALVSASTDSFGNVTRIYSDATGVIGATITNAAGQIVNTWGAMADQTTATSAGMSEAVIAASAAMASEVTANTNLMASGALTSVTNMGAGILTTVADTSGTTIATMTDMGGQVTSQIAQMANGAILDTANMAGGVLTSSTQMHDGVITSVQDMAGNVVVTVTDLQGNVTNQYTQMASSAQRTVDQTVDAFGEVAPAADDVSEAVRQMGDSFKNIKKPDLGPVISEFKKTESAIKSAISAADRFADKTGSKGSPGKGALGSRAAGGPVSAFDTYLVGEAGPELFVPRTSGTIVPNDAIGSGGSMDTIRVDIAIGGAVAESIYLQGRDLAIRRGRA